MYTDLIQCCPRQVEKKDEKDEKMDEGEDEDDPDTSHSEQGGLQFIFHTTIIFFYHASSKKGCKTGSSIRFSFFSVGKSGQNIIISITVIIIDLFDKQATTNP